MVKTPRTRHSRPKREPVTIDLEADAVRRESEGGSKSAAEEEIAATKPGESEGAEDTAAEGSAGLGDGKQATESRENAVSGEHADAEAEANNAAPVDTDGGDRQQEEEEPETSAGPGRSGGFGRALAAGLIGGLAALALAAGLQRANILPALNENGPDPAVESLHQELAAVQNELSQMRQAGSDGAPAGQLSQLEDQLRQLQETVSQLQSAPAGGGEQHGALLQRIGQVERSIETAAQAAEAAQQATGSNTQRLQDIANQVTQLSKQLESQDEGPRLALIVAASALKSAVESGAPFASELETYSALASDASAVEPLKPYATTGVPTRAELSSEAPEVASHIAATESQVPQDAGLLDRLIASARSSVKVRPVGEVEGKSPEAVAARMEAAVQKGDYAQALTEYEALPPQAKEAASAFADKLRARQSADQILQEALSGALKPA